MKINNKVKVKEDVKGMEGWNFHYSTSYRCIQDLGYWRLLARARAQNLFHISH